MTEEMRPIRCHWGRSGREACMEPATVEVVGPAPAIYCEEHARHRAQERLPEGWESLGVEEYARACEEAVNFLYRSMGEPGASPTLPGTNVVLYDVLSEALAYLERYELRRARAKLTKAGGKPHATEEELEMLRYFDESARRFGWTEEPPWVPKVREWAEAAR